MINMEMDKTKIQQEISKFGIADWPNESCGMIVKAGENKTQVLRCRNVSTEPQNFFVMNAEDAQAIESKHEVIAYWHTHTQRSNRESEADRAGCNATETPWFIVSIIRDELPDERYEWRVSDINVLEPTDVETPYIGRPYVFGIFDCWTLCRDYLFREFGITIATTPNLFIPNWFKGSDDLISNNYKRLGFVDVVGEPQVGDILVMQYGKNMPDHCSVYIGNGQIMHHQMDRLSCRAIYGGMYVKHTVLHVRHKDLMRG